MAESGGETSAQEHGIHHNGTNRLQIAPRSRGRSAKSARTARKTDVEKDIEVPETQPGYDPSTHHQIASPDSDVKGAV